MDDGPNNIGELVYDTAEIVAASTNMADEGAIVIKAAIIIDAINAEGDRALVDLYVTDRGHKYATPWDAKGMLREALDQYDRMRGRSGD